MDQKILKLIYRSFDDQLTREEQQQLDAALESSLELRKEKARIASMRNMVFRTAGTKFEPNFAERVMSQIHSKIENKSATVEDFFNSILWSFRRFAMAGAVAILLLLAINIIKNESLSIDSVLGIPQLTIENTWQLDDLIEGELQ
jgi:hypothetical protein